MQKSDKNTPKMAFFIEFFEIISHTTYKKQIS